MQPADEAARIRVKQELEMVEPMSSLRFVWTICAIAVGQSRRRIRQIAVPDLVGVFRHCIARDLVPPRRLEQAQVDPFGMCGEHREIDTKPVPGRPEWK